MIFLIGFILGVALHIIYIKTPWCEIWSVLKKAFSKKPPMDLQVWFEPPNHYNCRSNVTPIKEDMK